MEVFLPGVQERPQHLDRLFLRDEHVQVACDPGHGREPAPHLDREAFDALVDDADQRDAVDLRRVAAAGARRDRDLVLARQVRVLGVAVEELGRLVDDRPGVEQLLVVDAGDRAARDVADRVAAAAGRGEARGVEPVEDLRQRSELDPVQLDVLSGRQLAVAAAERVRDLPERAQAGRRDAAARELDPEHERPDLRLVVVEAPPLQPHHVLLRHLLVAGSDEGGQLVEDPERALVALDALDGIALVDELPVRFRSGSPGAWRGGHPGTLPTQLYKVKRLCKTKSCLFRRLRADRGARRRRQRSAPAAAGGPPGRGSSGRPR